MRLFIYDALSEIDRQNSKIDISGSPQNFSVECSNPVNEMLPAFLCLVAHKHFNIFQFCKFWVSTFFHVPHWGLHLGVDNKYLSIPYRVSSISNLV